MVDFRKNLLDFFFSLAFYFFYEQMLTLTERNNIGKLLCNEYVSHRQKIVWITLKRNLIPLLWNSLNFLQCEFLQNLTCIGLWKVVLIFESQGSGVRWPWIQVSLVNFNMWCWLSYLVAWSFCDFHCKMRMLILPDSQAIMKNNWDDINKRPRKILGYLCPQ